MSGDQLELHHVDVFSSEPLSGNGLAVVVGDPQLGAGTMLRIAQELALFETIFLTELTADGADARIFTPEEELTFAGHPVLGAAAVLHTKLCPSAPEARWRLRVGGRYLPVGTRVQGEVVVAEMDQGPATISPPLTVEQSRDFASALGVPPEQLRTDLPVQVATTGLPYLLVPVTADGLAGSHVADPDLPAMLAQVGADFVYVLDPDRPEGRTWDQRGTTEDVATGSAAGPTAAYLVHHRRRSIDEPFLVHQGQYVGRPSRMRVRVDEGGSVHVGGPVAPFSSGFIRASLRQQNGPEE